MDVLKILLNFTCYTIKVHANTYPRIEGRRLSTFPFGPFACHIPALAPSQA